MPGGAARRAFLRGRFRKTEPIRPPGAGDWESFADACTRCEDCAAACPENIIAFDDDGFPFLDPAKGACTFCNGCAEACDTGALAAERPWPWKANVAKSCLSANGVQCRACEDICEQRAITFRLATGGRAFALIDTERCIGCGACVGACFAGAVSLEKPASPEEETAQC